MYFMNKQVKASINIVFQYEIIKFHILSNRRSWNYTVNNLLTVNVIYDTKPEYTWTVKLHLRDLSRYIKLNKSKYLIWSQSKSFE